MNYPTPERPPQACHVLVVDDDVPTVRMMQFLLEGEGLEVSAAADGDTAISELLRQLPDLILLNVTLPDTDGFQLHEQFRKLGYTGPVVLVTARPDVPEMLHALQMDVAGCIIKPLHLEEVLRLVRQELPDAGGRDAAEAGRYEETHLPRLLEAS